ncbi:flavin oxidoreductase hxnT [Colletotrichum liriopes]|uniref:Flavin oxidoreductase hxnT n=1 Tax=Colletotrichum liriopes TaxID=708192 RepID=A0AA37LVQ9_9PEZI|nr:flavin oxidoreductase hxnT [Colletotrichum liriopes]
MSREDIVRTIDDFVTAAKAAIEIGFDGVEINGGNGNLLDQFLHSNINTRTDAYGGSPEKRAKFPLELGSAVVQAVGPSSVAIRLEPRRIYNHTRGAERVEIWSLSVVSNVHFRQILRDTPTLTCGVTGTFLENHKKALEQRWDAIVFAKWFVSNPDLPARLKNGAPLHAYDRSRLVLRLL